MSKMSTSADVYALGMLMWQACKGQIPYAGMAKAQVIMQVTKGLQIKLPEDAPPSYRHVFEMCTAGADERPSAEEICAANQGMIEETESKDANVAQEVSIELLLPVPEEPKKHNLQFKNDVTTFTSSFLAFDGVTQGKPPNNLFVSLRK
eukprot:gnl/MRDRNA2_/MRDRNA2_76246_c0_seq1.p1 gnl/MRDRNA2_/MRDRNA2_76246_c0~~gnl/MRDRNA2_/MRDRNA2_76246_c0_seq1.p1  ORF type:complete len:149 (+),score=25.89 gnl/MRDRNA2_/MRDRNA2_76246_c0_seq1:451-897(+)